MLEKSRFSIQPLKQEGREHNDCIEKHEIMVTNHFDKRKQALNNGLTE